MKALNNWRIWSGKLAVLAIMLLAPAAFVASAPSETLPARDGATLAKDAVGLWVMRDDVRQSMVLLELIADGTGLMAGIGSGTAIGDRIRWKVEGNVIEVTAATDTDRRRVMTLRMTGQSLLMSSGDGREVELERTEDPQLYQLLHPPPMPPDPPAEPANAQGQDRYYESGATEAIVRFGGENAVEVGGEALAPPHVRRLVESFRAAMRERFELVAQPLVTVSPDGKAVILNGFRKTGGVVTWIWNDWRKADEVTEQELYFRGGGRFLSNRLLYLGEDWILDRQTGSHFRKPPVGALNFVVSVANDWAGLLDDRTTFRVGRLSEDNHEPEFREIKLDQSAENVSLVNHGNYVLIRMLPDGARVYDKNGQMVGHLQDQARIAAQISDNEFFACFSFNSCAILTIDGDGSMRLSDRRELRCRPDRVSPSGRYVQGLGFRQKGDRHEVDRTRTSDQDLPLPPRPAHGTQWLSWADQ